MLCGVIQTSFFLNLILINQKLSKDLNNSTSKNETYKNLWFILTLAGARKVEWYWATKIT